MKIILLLLTLAAIGMALKDGHVEKAELFLIGLGAFCTLFTNPGGDHKNEG